MGRQKWFPVFTTQNSRHSFLTQTRPADRPHPNLKEINLPIQNEHKFLGVTFDKKLTFLPHINILKKKASGALNILKVRSRKHWGSDRSCLLQVYRSVVRSCLDYGCIVYGSARQSYLKRLDPVHNLGLRLSSGAYRTSPISSLYVETNEPPLTYRRLMLTCSYILKIRSLPKHLCYPIVTKCPSRTLFNNKPQAIRPLLLRFEEKCQELGMLDTLPGTAHKTKQLPPWYTFPAVCDFTLTHFQKKKTPREHILQEFLALNEKYKGYTSFYTDGSKTACYAGSAIIQGKWEKVIRLPQCASVFTAESYAIAVAVERIRKESIPKSVIYTDSLSAITALHYKNAAQPIIGDIIHNLVTAKTQGQEIKLCWVPSHVGINGNERADACAAQAGSKTVTQVHIPHSDCMKFIRSKLRETWQSSWDNETDNKLHIVKPTIAEWESSKHEERYTEVILCRLRIGHTHLTHNFLLMNEDKPRCEECDQELTVNHMLLSCTKFEVLRKKHFRLFYDEHIPFHPSLLLGENALVKISSVFSFIKEAGFLSKL